MSEFERISNIKIDFDAIVNGAFKVYPAESLVCLKYGMIPQKIFNHLSTMIKEKIVTIQLEQYGEIVNDETIKIGLRLIKKDISEALEKELASSMLKIGMRSEEV